jgi:hypothetical protein
MKPVDDAIPKTKVRRRLTMDLRRATRLFVTASQEEADTFVVEVRQSGWRSDEVPEAAPAAGPVEPQSAPRTNGKQK